MTTGEIMTTLAGLTYYSGQTYTVEEQFQLRAPGMEDFSKFPLIQVVDGNESASPIANSVARISYHPSLHLFTVNKSESDLKLWRDNIRNAVLSSAALWTGDNIVNVDSITLEEIKDRKQQHIAFALTIEFDKQYTIA